MAVERKIYVSGSGGDTNDVKQLTELLRHHTKEVESRTIEQLGTDLPDVLILCVSGKVSTQEQALLQLVVPRFKDPGRRSNHLIVCTFGGESEEHHFGAVSIVDLSGHWESGIERLQHALERKESVRRLPDSSLALGVETVAPGLAQLAGSTYVAKSGRIVRAENVDHKQDQTGKAVISAMSELSDNTIGVGWRNGAVATYSSTGAPATVVSPLGNLAGEVVDLCSIGAEYVVAHTARDIAVFNKGGETVWSFSNDVSGYRCAAAHRDIAIGANDGSVHIFRVDSQGESWVASAPELAVGHNDIIRDVCFSLSGDQLFSASEDRTVRVWDVETLSCIRVLEGFIEGVSTIAITSSHVAAAGYCGTIIVWSLESLAGTVKISHTDRISHVELEHEGDQLIVHALDFSGMLHTWRISDEIDESETSQYLNAKVLLVGDSQAGKTGLAQRLVDREWTVAESTVGAWASQWQLPETADDADQPGSREIWLWDFGGQSDQQAVHQLFMSDTSLSVLVFDGHRPDCLNRIRDWARVIDGAAKDAPRLLVAGRTDVNRVLPSAEEVGAVASELGFDRYVETSAKTGLGCDELELSIRDCIRWDEIPWRSSPSIFRRIKDAVLTLRSTGLAVTTVGEIRDAIALDLPPFTVLELRAVLGLLSGPGAVLMLPFGTYVLLRPEILNNYAQLIFRDIRSRPADLGSIMEEAILSANIDFPSDFERLDIHEERVVLHALYELFVRNGLCIREGFNSRKRPNILIFPSLQAKGRPSRSEEIEYFSRYYFAADIEETYARLVVRLLHSDAWSLQYLWRSSSRFSSETGKTATLAIDRDDDGDFIGMSVDQDLTIDQLAILQRFVHNQILSYSVDVRRVRTFRCPGCSTSIRDAESVEYRQLNGERDAACIRCEERVPIWDEIEDRYADPSLRDSAIRMQAQSERALDNESKERILVGEVIAKIALAGEISREFQVSDHGIDMEVEFKLENGDASGKKVYLQLKSGDSHLKTFGDRLATFRVRKSRHLSYWSDQAFDVLLVWRDGKGQLFWANLTDALKNQPHSNNLELQLDTFDVAAIQKWKHLATR